jgi:histidyl-tRNA synthetase
MTEFLCDECAPHYAEVKRALADAGVAFEEDPHLVRGLDYYTKTVYEITHDALGARSAICGGGRYDTLVESLSGPATPCVGFAMGVEASLLAIEAVLGEHPDQAEAEIDVYVVCFGQEAATAAFRVLGELRDAGIAADMDYEGRSAKAQMKTANKLGARFTVLLGEDELAAGAATLRDMASSEQTRVPRDELAARLLAALKA